MWSRSDLKMKGKQAFKRNYWPAVLVAFVMSIFSAASASSFGGSSSTSDSYSTGGYDEQSMTVTAIALMVTAIVSIIFICFMLLKIFIGNALIVGGYHFFVTNQTESPTAGTLGHVFRTGNFWNVVITMFLRDLFIGLWSLLLIVPGIIKSYEYLMVPYILAENPAMDRKEAFLISKKMMTGQKWNTFVLDLSFIGWRILEGITFGIVGFFYVEPYYQATIAELYSYNRSVAYQNGYIR